jgi:WD40 repeat protein
MLAAIDANTLAATDTSSKTIQIWDLSKQSQIKQLAVAESYMSGITFLKSGHLLIASYNPIPGTGKLKACDSVIQIWDVKQWNCIKTFKLHLNPIRELIPLSENHVAISCYGDNTIYVHDLESGKLQSLMSHTGEVRALTLMKDGQLMSGSVDNSIRIWDFSREVNQEQLESEHSIQRGFSG